jgi:hypothetical protein
MCFQKIRSHYEKNYQFYVWELRQIIHKIIFNSQELRIGKGKYIKIKTKKKVTKYW